jgi:hypothetical protein
MQLGTEGAYKCFQFGSEHHSVLTANEVEGLDTELVSSEKEGASRLIEYGKGEHSSKARQALRSPATPCLEDDLSVRVGGEGGPGRGELRSDLTVIVELAVVAEHERLLDQRLLTVLQVDDGKSTVGEMRVDPLVSIREPTLFVRAPVIEAPTHLLGCRVTVYLLIGAGYAAHRSAPNRRCNTRS